MKKIEICCKERESERFKACMCPICSSICRWMGKHWGSIGEGEKRANNGQQGAGLFSRSSHSFSNAFRFGHSFIPFHPPSSTRSTSEHILTHSSLGSPIPCIYPNLVIPHALSFTYPFFQNGQRSFNTTKAQGHDRGCRHRGSLSGPAARNRRHPLRCIRATGRS